MTTWAHAVSRQLIDHAVRRRCAAIVYDDTERQYVRSFPWDWLRQRVQEKAEAAGLSFSDSRRDAGVLTAIDTDEDVLA
jgi:hypothetical protein